MWPVSVCVRNSNNYMNLKLLIQIGWKKFLSGIVMFAIVFQVGNLLKMTGIMVILVQICLGIGVYVLGLYCLRDHWTIQCIGKVLGRITGKIKC